MLLGSSLYFPLYSVPLQVYFSKLKKPVWNSTNGGWSKIPICWISLTSSVCLAKITIEAVMMWRKMKRCNRRQQFLGDRTFGDLGLGYIALRELAGFIRSLGWFKPSTNESCKLDLRMNLLANGNKLLVKLTYKIINLLTFN